MKITIHRGINQIGGCITEIATENTRILIDLGRNLPDGDKTGADNLANQEAIEKLTAGIDAVFYTHYHGDHVDLFHYVPDSIKQYIGETAKKVVIRKYQELCLIPGEKEKHSSHLPKIERMIPLKAAQAVSVNDIKKEIKVTPYFVSHSAYESYMFLIEAEGKRILHTGDFRDHGYLGNGLMKILNAVLKKGGVDVLIIEGTMMSRRKEHVKTENELQREAFEAMSKYKNVFVFCSSTDMERLATFRAANRQFFNKPFLCDNYQKDILKIFSESAGKENKLFDFGKVYDFKENNDKLISYMKDSGFCMLVRPTEKFSNYYKFLRNHINDEDTVLIYSMWKMYIDPESRHKKQQHLDFVSQFPDVKKIYTSGHASPKCLAEVCEIVNPALGIIPIHGEKAEDFLLLGVPDALKSKLITAPDFEF